MRSRLVRSWLFTPTSTTDLFAFYHLFRRYLLQTIYSWHAAGNLYFEICVHASFCSVGSLFRLDVATSLGTVVFVNVH